MKRAARGKYTRIDLKEHSEAFKWLLGLNAAALAVHLAFAVAFFSAKSKPSHDVQLVRVVSNWTSGGLNGFALSIQDDTTLSYRVLGGFSFAAAVVAHLVAVYALASWLLWQAPHSFSEWYVRNVCAAFHPLRWAEYGVSAAAQAVTIALGAGIREKYTLLCIFVGHSITMSFGFLAELHARPDDRWMWKTPLDIRLAPFWGGCAAIATPWYVIIASFVAAIDDTRRMRHADAPEMPSWVYLALVGTFVTFFSFAVNALVFLVIRPSVRRFLWCEAIYALLSLTSKVWLGALVYVNVVM